MVVLMLRNSKQSFFGIGLESDYKNWVNYYWDRRIAIYANLNIWHSIPSYCPRTKFSFIVFCYCSNKSLMDVCKLNRFVRIYRFLASINGTIMSRYPSYILLKVLINLNGYLWTIFPFSNYMDTKFLSIREDKIKNS